jgi:hypothetical protein
MAISDCSCAFNSLAWPGSHLLGVQRVPRWYVFGPHSWCWSYWWGRVLGFALGPAAYIQPRQPSIRAFLCRWYRPATSIALLSVDRMRDVVKVGRVAGRRLSVLPQRTTKDTGLVSRAAGYRACIDAMLPGVFGQCSSLTVCDALDILLLFPLLALERWAGREARDGR